MEYELSVVAPCYNESKNLEELVDRLQKVFLKKALNCQIVLVDDGSKDDTAQVLRRLKSQHHNVEPVFHPTNRGIVPAWKSGVDIAQGNYVCLIDADLQNLPEDVWRLYREIKTSHADMVQGFRSSIGRLRDSRFLLSKGLNFILNNIFSMRLKDNKSGFVIALKETLQDVLSYRYKYRYFQSFISVSAHWKGYTIREIETLFESRCVGKSFIPKFPLKVVAGCLQDIVKAFFEFRLAPKKESFVADFLRNNPPDWEDEPLSLWRRAWMRLFFLTMPLHKWMISRRAELYYKELKQSQWLSPEHLKKLQLQKLRRLIHHAYYHVGYYRQRMDELGLKVNQIRKLEDLQKFPLLSKDDVRENLYFDLLSDNHDKKKILKVATSGSTGEPFVCYADQHQLEIRWASTLRSMEWTGYRFGDRQARLWHQTLGMTWLQVVREKIDAFFNRRLFIPAFEMNDASIRRFVRKLQKFKPVLLDGYAESFNFLAQYIKSQKLDGVHPRAIISSAQVLPQQSRAIMEQAFDCGVYDKYGSREFSGIAYECEQHQGHHVVAESYIVEILKNGQPAKPGEMGEIVITDLNNFAVPLIRYRVGDLATAMDPTERCRCGRGLPRIGQIQGRVQAIVMGTKGNYIPGTFFAHLFKDYDYLIRQYKVIQEERGSITLLVVKAYRFDEADFLDVLQSLRKYLGEDMKIDVQFVDKIPMVRTGKQQGSISKLNFDFQTLSPSPLT